MTSSPRWDPRGLCPAIAQDARTGVVLMLAWVNAEALTRTRASGHAHFYSRSRSALWKKGESSGNVLRVIEIRLDCDHDAILYQVVPSGPACHTGALSCFFRGLDAAEPAAGPPYPLAATWHRLEDLLRLRKRAGDPTSSYTAQLLAAGPRRIGEKILEEARELVVELDGGARERVVSECADLLYHVWVGLAGSDVDVDEIAAELQRRLGRGGLDEKASRAPADAAKP